MMKTIPAVYRSGVFVPLEAVNEIAEETSLEIEVHFPPLADDEDLDEGEYSLEEALALLYQTSGIVRSDLPADEVRDLIESPQFAQENIWLAMDQS